MQADAATLRPRPRRRDEDARMRNPAAASETSAASPAPVNSQPRSRRGKAGVFDNSHKITIMTAMTISTVIGTAHVATRHVSTCASRIRLLALNSISALLDRDAAGSSGWRRNRRRIGDRTEFGGRKRNPYIEFRVPATAIKRLKRCAAGTDVVVERQVRRGAPRLPRIGGTDQHRARLP